MKVERIKCQSFKKKKKIPVISQIKAREIPLTETGQGNLEGTH